MAHENGVLANMVKKDQLYRADPLYLMKNPSIHQSIRTTVFHWHSESCGRGVLQSETLFLAVNIFDRCLSKMNLQRKKIPVLAATILFISAKVEEVNPLKLKELAEEPGEREEILDMDDDENK